MRKGLPLLLSMFLMLTCCGMDQKEFNKRRDAAMRAVGLLEPVREDVLTELGQGWLLGFNKVLGRETVLATNQHWNAPPDGSASHSVGYVLGLSAPILLPVALFMAVMIMRKWQKNRVARAEAKEENAAVEDAARVMALDELENGQTDRLAFAKAVEESNGDAARAKSLYIKFRVEQVLKQKQQERKEQKNYSSNN